MSLSAAALQLLLDKGMTLADAIELAGVIEEGFAAPAPTATSMGALRTRKYRERLAATGMSAEDWRLASARIIARDGAVCSYCGTTKGRMCCDHVVPLIGGGDSTDENLVCACESCNGGKAGRSLLEWKGAAWLETWASRRVTSRDVTERASAPASPPFPPEPPKPTPTPPDITTRARGGAAKPNGFARFWEAYPNKTGKLAAEKAFARALKSIPGPDPPAVLLAGVERAKASREWAEGYIPHPTTWLNQGRWDDEPAEVVQLQPRKAHERPHHDAKFAAKQANLAALDRGFDLAAGSRGKP